MSLSAPHRQHPQQRHIERECFSLPRACSSRRKHVNVPCKRVTAGQDVPPENSPRPLGSSPSFSPVRRRDTSKSTLSACGSVGDGQDHTWSGSVNTEPTVWYGSVTHRSLSEPTKAKPQRDRPSRISTRALLGDEGQLGPSKANTKHALRLARVRPTRTRRHEQKSRLARPSTIVPKQTMTSMIYRTTNPSAGNAMRHAGGSHFASRGLENTCH